VKNPSAAAADHAFMHHWSDVLLILDDVLLQQQIGFHHHRRRRLRRPREYVWECNRCRNMFYISPTFFFLFFGWQSLTSE